MTSAGAPVVRLWRVASLTPAGHLSIVWALTVVFFEFGPIRYTEVPAWTTWLFVGACLVAFSAGGVLEAWMRDRAPQRLPERIAARFSIDVLIRATAILGLFGAACIAVDKLLLSGLDFSHGVTAIRFAREQAVNEGIQMALPRSPLLYLGYVTFAFSVAAFLLYLLTDTPLRPSTKVLAVSSLASPFAYSFVYGGRSPLFLVIGMACAAVAVRALTHSRWLPNRGAAISLVGLIAATVLYSNWILAERFDETGASSYDQLQQRFETSYGATIASLPAATAAPTSSTASSAPSLAPTASPVVASARPALAEQAAMHVVMNAYYVSHELPMLDRTLRTNARLGPYLGAYQFYLVGALVERIVPNWNIDAVMIPQLKAANVYGWFSTAWGGMYLDFGLIGALIAVTLCGWLSSRTYHAALAGPNDGARLLMCYVFAGIVASPILSIFTISISLPILASLIITAALLGVAWRSPVALAQPRSA